MKKFKILFLLSFFIISCAVQCAEKYVYFNEHDEKTISMVGTFKSRQNLSEQDFNKKHDEIIKGIEKEYDSFERGKNFSKMSKYDTITLTTFYFDEAILDGIKRILNLEYSPSIKKLRFSNSVFKTQKLLDNLNETFGCQEVEVYSSTVRK